MLLYLLIDVAAHHCIHL